MREQLDQRDRNVQNLSEARAQRAHRLRAQALAEVALSPGQGHGEVRAPDGVWKEEESTHLLVHRSLVVVPEQQHAGVPPVARVTVNQLRGRGVGDSRANGDPQGLS